MIGFSNQKGRDIRKPVPGCMGRMINLFDLGSGISSGTKLLTDKPNRDGLQITRDCISDVEEESDPVGTIKGKPVVHLPKCLSTNNKVSGTPVKMLMAEELSKEREVACKQPTVIAKLMGLDALPVQQPSIRTVKRDTQDRGAHNGHNSKKSAPQKQGIGFLDRLVIPKQQQQHPPHHHVQQYRECRDVYEFRPQIPGTKNLEYAPPQSRGKHDYNMNDKRMALVRQKFTEAKRLATSQNVLQSKEFQDALEVLSSNRDLFLKFLEEPDSMLSQHLRGQQQQQARNPTANRGKWITVLRPMTETPAANSMRQAQMENDLFHETNRRIKNDTSQSSRAGLQKTGSLLPQQPTRIVVLKPSPGKNRNAGSRETSFPSTTICIPKEPVPNEGLVHNEARDAREAAKEITRQMRESLSRRDETLLSHILSNVTTEEEDEDPFSRSGKEHVEEEDECTCSSTSHDSWKYRDPFGSPCSFSSRSQYPYLPESSVIREAKRRLSERWVLVTSSGVKQEPQEIQRSSSTLGEMLSLREAKKKEQDSRDERFGYTARKNRDDCRLNSQMNLQRQRSVPRSCSGREKAESDAKVVINPHSSNNCVVDEVVDKTKYYETLSFKGKVSNLLFSRNSKTSNTDRSPSYSSYMDHVTHESSKSGNREVSVKGDRSPLQCSIDGSPKEGPIYNYEDLLRKNLYPSNSNSVPGTPASTKKESLPLEKLMASEDASDNNLEQPSPVSILEAPFEDDAIGSSSSSLSHANVNQERHCASPRCLPTEPVACSLSWDDGDGGDDTQESTNHSKPVTFKKSTEDEEEEEEYVAFARLLLSSSSLGDDASIAMTGWHSLDSPLDPSLLRTFLEPKEEVAKSRERRSNQRLLFDCVNATILDISRSNLLHSCPWPWPVSGRQMTSPGKPEAAADSVTEEEVLGAVRSLLSANNGSDDSSNSSLIADLIIRKEILGMGWEEEMLEMEVVEMVVEIQGQVVEELVAEALCCW